MVWSSACEPGSPAQVERVRTTTNGQAAAKGFGAPTSSDGAYQGDASNPQGLHYTFGGRRSRTNANTIGTVYTHWPGNFFYRGFPERLMARKGWTIWFPQAFVKDSTTRYMLGGYGSFTTEGQDIVRLESRDPFDQQVYYQLPPPWSTGNRLFQCEYGNGDWTEGGLPELAGGGTDTQGPWLPPDRSTDYPNAFIYGSPDGHKDAIIIVLTGGDEVQAY